MLSEQIKTKQSFDVDYMDILYEDDSVSIVSVLVLHEGINRNKSNLPHDVIVNALPTLANKPIWAIPNATIFKSDASDFTEHARNENDEKNIMIFGVFPESGVNQAEFIELNGKTYLKVQAVIWKLYAPIAMSILKNRDGQAKISIEINVCGTQDDDGILNVSEMQFLSATVLGAKIPEGIEGSSLEIVRYSLDQTIAEGNNQYLNFSQSKKYKIPKSVKDSAILGLQMKNQIGNNGKSFCSEIANYIIKNDFIFEDKMKILVKYFSESKNNDKISWLLYGGDSSKEWIKELNKLEDEKLEFVSKDELGSKDKIIIDKSKDSLSEGAWSDKGLAKACLEASNWKTVCKAVFQKRDEGWEDGKETALGYPVMEKVGNKVVYNHKGLASARGYAVKNNETAVLASIKAIYKHLELPWDEDDAKSKENNSKKEDDVMEENKNAKKAEDTKDTEKVDNSVKDDKPEVKEDECKNASDTVVPDDSSNDVDTGDCVDIELDEYKKKVESLTKECDTLKNTVAEYKAKEQKAADMETMTNLLNTYAHCYSEDELTKAKEAIKNSSVEDFSKSVDDQVKSFALKMKDNKDIKDKPEEKDKTDKAEDKKDDKEKQENSLKFSISSFGVFPSYDFSKITKDDGSDSSTKYGVKI